MLISLDRSRHQRCSMKRGVLRKFAKFTGNTFFRVSFLIKLHACNFIKKETLAQVFSCEFCEFSKNTFFIEDLLTNAAVYTFSLYKNKLCKNDEI